MTDRFDRIAERLEQRAEKRLSAAARDRRKTGFERQLSRHEVGLPLTSTTQGGIEPTREHHREQRRCNVRPVIDVLVLGAALAAAATNHTDRIDVEENGRRARFLARLRVEAAGEEAVRDRTVALPNGNSRVCTCSGCLWSRNPRSVAGWWVVRMVGSMRVWLGTVAVRYTERRVPSGPRGDCVNIPELE